VLQWKDKNVKTVVFPDKDSSPSQICMDHILFVLRTPDERASGFVALGEMAGALGVELVPYLPAITPHLQDAVCSWQALLYPDVYLKFVMLIGPCICRLLLAEEGHLLRQYLV